MIKLTEDQRQVLLASECLPVEEQRDVLRAARLRAIWDDPEMDVYDRQEISETGVIISKRCEQ